MATYAGTPGSDAITSGFNILYGDDGNDLLASDQPGLAFIDGGGGSDLLGLVGNNLAFGEIYGGAGADTIVGFLLDDVCYGGEGDDIVAGGTPNADILRWTQSTFGTANDRLDGGGGRDAVYGFDGNDVIFGGDGDDDGATVTVLVVQAASGLYGGDGADLIDGGPGNDLVVGGGGTDLLIGGTGADRFLFDAATDSGKGPTRDVIRDFFRTEGDRIDLSPIDTKTKPGDQAFKYIKANDFHDKQGEVRFAKGVVSVDVDGNGKADFQIKLLGVDQLSRDDFIL